MMPKLNLYINNNADIEKSFNQIAQLLLNESVLFIEEKCFRITEIEFYYYHKHYHPDIATHKSCMQKISNQWYVHEAGRGGIDITFGNEDCYGGILIRGIRERGQNEKYIDGPLNVLKYIQKMLQIPDRKHLRKELQNITQGRLKLVLKKEIKKEQVFQGPRVGLVQSDNSYTAKPYRYLIEVNKNHNFKEKTNVYLYTKKLNPEIDLTNLIGYKLNINNAIQNLKKYQEIYKFLCQPLEKKAGG